MPASQQVDQHKAGKARGNPEALIRECPTQQTGAHLR
jgi:hypothetical protein